ncbi:MAG TPA: helix-turn-helix domain-containing protein [Gemmatimonadales bacterium]|nr:helix-turn-helix domain-containing protein [Gemmatimonadales bacterium]
MDYLELSPPPPLDRVVHRFWFLRTGDGPDASGTQTIVPDGRAEIVLHLGEPFAELDQAGRARPQQRALVAGQLTAPFRLRSCAGADVVGIRLRTGGAQRLLALPQSELTGRVVPLADVMRGVEARLLDAVRGEFDLGRRAAMLGAALARTLDLRPDGPIEAAVARLETDRSCTVGDLARSVGLTPRSLQRRFQSEVGMDPTLFRRILRFRAAFGQLERLPPGRWSRVASRAGYFDQAHLIRDFRRFAGASPSAFFGADPELARAFSGGQRTG